MSTSTNYNDSSRLQIFVRVWAGFALLLFASTWKLWTPQTDFPQIPFFEFLVDVPGWADWVSLVAIGISLAICVFCKRRSTMTGSLWLFAIAATLSILLNQHRLQPWAYQFVVFAVIMAATTPKTAFFWLRWIVISIYVYSAISKFDYQFVFSVGDQMLWSLAEKIGFDLNRVSVQARTGIVLMFPAAEFLIGVGLMVRRLRRFAVLAAILMHSALLIVLFDNVFGYGVLLWNAFFIFQAIWLFDWRLKSTPATPDSSVNTPTTSPRVEPSTYPLNFAATAVALIVLLFPITETLGVCDHWPAWQVYAPRTSRANMNQAGNLDANGDFLDLSAWSGRLGVPVYPQARFQFAVLMAARQRYPEALLRPINVIGTSNRRTGKRETKVLSGDQFKMHAMRYRLNVKPRSFWSH